MDAFRMRVVEIERPVGCYLLFEADVHCVDARVFVIATKHAHTAETWERVANTAVDARRDSRRRRRDTRPHWTRHAQRDDRRIQEDRLLLHAVRRDRSDLRQHVLSRVVDAGARANDRFAFLRDIPGESHTRLPLALLIRERSVRREARIVQEDAVCGALRWYDGVGKDLCFPAETVVERNIGPDLPRVLCEEGIVFIRDARKTGGVSCWTSQTRALKVEQERTATRQSPWTSCRRCYESAV